ncbi:pyridoxal phosphate-dependent aminotransferase [Patescibacteria group bacterium]
MDTANRMERLGTETAYAVAASAAEFAAKGGKVYPFHLGDMNLPTPSNITNAAQEAIANGKTGYCPAAGVKDLREALAKSISEDHHVDYTWENVCIQPGGKPVIGKFLMTVMEQGDEVLYPNPGYPIYESMIDFYGGVTKPYRFKETDQGFVLDMDFLKSQITPKTRILIYNNYQNPVGTVSSEQEMEKIAKLAIEHDLYVLSDEAYWNILYDVPQKSIITYPGMRERTMILYTFSKTYAMTGWRLGAAIGPKDIINLIAKINTNDEACTNHFVQWAGLEALTGDQTEAKKIVDILRERRDVLVDEVNSVPGLKAYKPDSTFYLFVNATELMNKMGFDDVEAFRLNVLEKTGVSFCTRLHFGKPFPDETEKYIRFAYSGINIDQIKEGIGKFRDYAKNFYGDDREAGSIKEEEKIKSEQVV